jgi:hypothetical protein
VRMYVYVCVCEEQTVQHLLTPAGCDVGIGTHIRCHAVPQIPPRETLPFRVRRIHLLQQEGNMIDFLAGVRGAGQVRDEP